jgi:phage baseplate assembly protein gpV
MIPLWNMMKGAGLASASQFGQNRWGTITSVKQTDSGYEARVTLQPEDVPSGWLPVLSHSVGAGWGVVSPPYPGMQAFIGSDTGDGHHGVILGMSYSLQSMPPVPPNGFSTDSSAPPGVPVQAGEVALVSKAGAVIRLCTDGSIHIKGNVRIDGSVSIQGNVSVAASSVSGAPGTVTAASDITSTGGDVYDKHGWLDRLRAIYDRHVHGSSVGPTPLDPE